MPQNVTGPAIVMSEVTQAIKKLKNGIAPIEKLLFEWLQSTLIALLKKNNAYDCEHHRLRYWYNKPSSTSLSLNPSFKKM